MSIKPDEIEFMDLVHQNEFKVPRDLWDLLTKRQYYLLEKWDDKGYWDCGVSVRSGWATDEGKEYFKRVLGKF